MHPLELLEESMAVGRRRVPSTLISSSAGAARQVDQAMGACGWGAVGGQGRAGLVG